MNILKSAGSWIIATLFSLFALAFLTGGGLAFLGRVFGGSPNTRFAGANVADLVLEIQPRS